MQTKPNPLLTRPDLVSARDWFAASCAASREWSATVSRMAREHGIPEHSTHVSGIGYDAFPEDVKDKLRDLARKVTRYIDQAYAHRPARVRYSTMIALARAVALRDGTGFYGIRV